MDNKNIDYDVLFTPYKIGKVTIKNRIGMSAMGLFSANTDGSPSMFTSAFYEDRARGGTGLIIVGASMVSRAAANGITGMYWEDKSVVPHHTDIVERCHRYGAKAAIAIGVGSGRNAFLTMLDGKQPVSASAIPSRWDPNLLCHPLTVDEIHEYVAGYEQAAYRAKCAGYDIIEVHAHCGYLIDQFMSPLWNHREDEYGGSDENRARFAIEILQAIKRGAGSDIPVIYRIAPDHRVPGSRTLENCGPTFDVLSKAGVDAFDCDAGCYDVIDYIFPTQYLGDAPLAYVLPTVRKCTDKPLLNAGNHTPETAAELISSGKSDFVLFGRGLICDPDLPKKLMNGERENVRPCMRCLEECVRRTVDRITKVSCALNPRVNEEMFFNIKKVEKPLNVMVVGGGPGGLEAARVAALEGNTVHLYEKSGVLGGNMLVASTPDFKSPIQDLLKWYELQMTNTGVNVHMNAEISADDPRFEQADLIVMATGANEFVPRIPGVDGANVVSVIDAHMNWDLVKGERIVVCGGGLSGCEAAYDLAKEKGMSVTVVEMGDKVLNGVFTINADSLLRKMQGYDITLRTSARVTRVTEEGVYIEHEGQEEFLPCDTVIAAFGLTPNAKVAEAVRAKYPKKTWIIGDSEEIGNIGKAVRGGYYAAMSLID